MRAAFLAAFCWAILSSWGGGLGLGSGLLEMKTASAVVFVDDRGGEDSDFNFYDAFGRARFFRGVNVVYKDPPFVPTMDTFHSNLSFVEEDADLLASMGINLIRLGVMWPGVNPREEGTTDRVYLENIRKIIKMCASRDPPIYVFVEPHQDEFHPRFCGEGAPTWYVEKRTSVTDFPVPVQASPFDYEDKTCERVPGTNLACPTRAQCDEHSSFSYIWTHDAAKAYQTLWSQGAAEFGAFWSTVASEFAAEPNVLGGEVWNEPFPGDVFFKNGKFRNNSAADLENLQPFYANVTAAIRAVVPDGKSFAVAYEPSWPVGDQDIHPSSVLPSTSGFSALPDQHSVYAFHYYVAPCDPNLTRYLDSRLADARRLHAAPYLSEINLGAGDTASQQRAAADLGQVEARGIAFTGWQYKSYSGSIVNGTCTGCGNSFFHGNGSSNLYMHRAMARPFLLALAGTNGVRTTSSDKFTLSYTTHTGNAETEIVVPYLWSRGEEPFVRVQPQDAAKAIVARRHSARNVAAGVKNFGWAVVTVKATKVGVNVTVTIEST